MIFLFDLPSFVSFVVFCETDEECFILSTLSLERKLFWVLLPPTGWSSIFFLRWHPIYFFWKWEGPRLQFINISCHLVVFIFSQKLFNCDVNGNFNTWLSNFDFIWWFLAGKVDCGRWPAVGWNIGKRVGMRIGSEIKTKM